MQVVRSWTTTVDDGQERVTQEAVLEDEGWRTLMRDEGYKFYGVELGTIPQPIHPSA